MAPHKFQYQPKQHHGFKRPYSEIKHSFGQISSKPVEDKLAPLKTNEVVRSIYPINKSGSKQIIVALDPAIDFLPVLTIGKPGWSGVRLDVEAWKYICDAEEYITNFFNGESDTGVFENVIHISNEEKLTFHMQYGRHVMCIASVMEGGPTVTLARTSWEGLLNVKKCINHQLDVLGSCSAEAFDFFATFVKAIKDRLPSEIVEHKTAPHVNVMKVFEKHVKELTFDCVMFAPYEHTHLDTKQLFLELQCFCVVNLAGYINSV